MFTLSHLKERNISPDGGPWKDEALGEDRDFTWQVRISPIIVEEFENPTKLSYENSVNPDTGISTGKYLSGMARISETQYRLVLQKMIENNMDQIANLSGEIQENDN